MLVYINGKATEIAERLTVAEIVAERGLNPNTVVVEHNLAIAPKEDWPRLVLSAQDRLEIISFVGGG